MRGWIVAGRKGCGLLERHTRVDRATFFVSPKSCFFFPVQGGPGTGGHLSCFASAVGGVGLWIFFGELEVGDELFLFFLWWECISGVMRGCVYFVRCVSSL